MPSNSSTISNLGQLDGVRINPYEDWEKTTRLSALQIKQGGIGPWNPVFVRLEGDQGEFPYRAAAWEVLRRVLQPSTTGDNVLAIDIIGLIFLIRAGQTKKTSSVPGQFASFFLWRPAEFAYCDETDLFTVEFVGPESATLSAETFKDFKGELPVTIFDKELSGNASDGTVVTAIIDDQIGFAHERFRSSESISRFGAVFVHQNETFQTEADRGGALVHIGGLLFQEQLDDFLGNKDEIDIYRDADKTAEEGGGSLFDGFLGFFLNKLLTDFKALREFRSSHGTFVADLAAGYPIDRSTLDRPLVAFDLSRLATGDTSGTRLDVFALMGIMFVTGVAPVLLGESQPVVINLSYALQAGPKDGGGFFEREATRLVDARNRNEAPTYLVLPSGNSFRSLSRARLSPGRFDTEHVDWHVQPGDETPSYAEFWVTPDETASLIVTPPVGNPHQIPLKLEHKVRQIDLGTTQIARVYHGGDGGRLRVTIAVAPTSIPDEPQRASPPGIWRLAIQTDNERVSCDINIQRDDTPSGYRSAGRQSYFDAPNVDAYDAETGEFNRPSTEDEPVGRLRTLSSYATANEDHTFVVGGAIGDSTLSNVALYSSSGPDALGRIGIDLSAISEESRAHPGRMAAGMMSSSSAVFSGTSTAAPLVARRIVDALSKDISITKEKLLQELLGTPTPPDLRLGVGTIPFDPPEFMKNRRI